MKRIALVDIHAGGHHLAFMQLFTKALVEFGNEVWVFYPEEQKIKEWVDVNIEGTPSIRFSNLSITEKKFTSFGKFNDMLSSAMLWSEVEKTIKQLETSRGEKIDFVFFAWLDSFLACSFPKMIHRMAFKYKWSGLYFHPRHLKKEPSLLKKKAGLSSVDHLLTSKRCISVATHDQYILEEYSRDRLNGKKVVFFPETADLSCPNEEYFLSKEIKKLANGRVIIGLVGLSYQQGLNTMIKLANQAPPDFFYFAFIGQINIKESEIRLDKELNKLIQNSPENCFFYLKSIEEEANYNSIISIIDILFLVYNDFTSTSNRLTKAAAFRTFVLGTNKYCIGADIKNYKLGITVDEGNVDQCVEALKALKIRLQSTSNQFEYFEKYSTLQSYESLKKQLEIVAN